ncbi:hypothetical protein FH972_023727 [Carpinus fangiana]|uniref:Hemerythrin-like domain-containing protein n=1 Tax=Carpinus fangiana TaxID=176857 RepID=A0A5N6KWE3_9ROSI|nr:hypothetical protein FH972_023727 [Carpinus fangiana]
MPTKSDDPTAQTDVKLSDADKKASNRMADMMELYHNSFRAEWNELYSACSPDHSRKVSASQLIRLGQGLISHLTMHHNIEEAHIFPILGQRMPAFRSDALTGPLQQHREIHAGMDKLGEYFNACKSGERSLRREEVKEICDSFGTVLWAHLDDEVEQLGWENMTKYWTKQEILRMPM